MELMYVYMSQEEILKNHCGKWVHVPIAGNDIIECAAKLRYGVGVE